METRVFDAISAEFEEILVAGAGEGRVVADSAMLNSISSTLVAYAKLPERFSSVVDGFRIIENRVISRLGAASAPSARAQKDSDLAHSSDLQFTVDQTSGDGTVEYRCLSLMLEAFKLGRSVGILEKMPIDLLKHCYDHLSPRFSPSVQKRAAELLGAISLHQLSECSRMFIQAMKLIKKADDERAFVPYQAATRYLAFSFGTSSLSTSSNVSASSESSTAGSTPVLSRQRSAANSASSGEVDASVVLQVSLQYFEELVTLLPRIERGVLRKQICDAMRVILCRSVSVDSVLKANATFSENFRKLFAMVSKWAKKSKHAVFSLSLMSAMLCTGGDDFFGCKKPNVAEDFFKILWPLISPKSDVPLSESMNLVHEFAMQVPISLVADHAADFESFMLKTLEILFPLKKTSSSSVVLDSDESRMLEDVLFALGRKHMSFTMNYIRSLLTEPYQDVCRAIALRALSRIAQDQRSKMEAYHLQFGPLLYGFLQSENVDLPILRSVFMCFPYIHHPSAEKMADIRDMAGTYTLHADRHVAQTAALSLKEFALLHSHTLDVLRIYAVILSNIDVLALRSSLVLRVFQQIQLVLSSLDLATIKILPHESQIMLVHLRVRLESVCLLWLLHSDPIMQYESLRLLHSLASSQMKEFQSVAQVPSEIFPPHVADVLSIEAPEHADVVAVRQLLVSSARPALDVQIQCSWRELNNRWNAGTLVSSSQTASGLTEGSMDEYDVDVDDAVRFDMVGNFAFFLISCVTLSEKDDHDKQANLAAGTVTLPPLPRIRNPDVYAFIGAFAKLLHTENDGLRNALVSASCHCDAAFVDQFVAMLRDINNAEKPNVLKKKSAGTAVLPDPVYESSVVQILANVFRRLDGSRFPASYPSLQEWVEQLVGGWIFHRKPQSSGNVYVGLPCASHPAALSIVCDWMRCMVQASSKMEPMILKNSAPAEYMKLFLDFIQLGAFQQCQHDQLNALGWLFAYAPPVESSEFVQQVLQFIRSYQVITEFHRSVIFAIRSIIRNNVSQVQSFVDMAVVNNDHVMFEAVVLEYVDDCVSIQRERIIFCTLLFASSPVVELRKLSFSLYSHFHPQYPLSSVVEDEETSLVEDINNSLVKHYSHLSAAFVAEVHRYICMVCAEQNSRYEKLLDGLRSVLTLLRPWMHNFVNLFGECSTVVDSNESSEDSALSPLTPFVTMPRSPVSEVKRFVLVNDSPVSVLRGLFKISVLFRERFPSLWDNVLDIWSSTIPFFGPSVPEPFARACAQVVHFFVDELEQCYLSSKPKLYERSSILAIMIHLSRPRYGQLLCDPESTFLFKRVFLQLLSAHFRSYGVDVSEPKQCTPFELLPAKAEAPTNIERAALNIALAVIGDALRVDYRSQKAVVLEELRHVLPPCVVQLRTLFSQSTYGEETYESRLLTAMAACGQCDSSSNTLQLFLCATKGGFAALSVDVAEMAFLWSQSSLDPVIRNAAAELASSLYIEILCKRLPCEKGESLSSLESLWLQRTTDNFAAALANVDAVFLCTLLNQLTAVTHHISGTTARALFLLCGSCLFTGDRQLFITALSAMQSVVVNCPGFVEDHSVLLEDVRSVFCPTKLDLSLDDAVMHTLVFGLLTPETVDLTLWLLGIVGKAIVESLPSWNKITISTLIGHYVCSSRSSVHAEFLAETGYSSLGMFATEPFAFAFDALMGEQSGASNYAMWLLTKIIRDGHTALRDRAFALLVELLPVFKRHWTHSLYVDLRTLALSHMATSVAASFTKSARAVFFHLVTHVPDGLRDELVEPAFRKAQKPSNVWAPLGRRIVRQLVSMEQGSAARVQATFLSYTKSSTGMLPGFTDLDDHACRTFRLFVAENARMLSGLESALKDDSELDAPVHRSCCMCVISDTDVAPDADVAPSPHKDGSFSTPTRSRSDLKAPSSAKTGTPTPTVSEIDHASETQDASVSDSQDPANAQDSDCSPDTPATDTESPAATEESNAVVAPATVPEEDAAVKVQEVDSGSDVASDLSDVSESED